MVLSILPKDKSNKEVVTELVDFILSKINESGSGGNTLMLMPAINIAKVKIAQMTDSDADFIVDAVHQISAKIEQDTGIYSKYHGTV